MTDDSGGAGFFETDDIRRDISRKTARSGIIQVSSQALLLLGYLASGMILARLLTPADFGLFALANTVIAIVGTIRDFGFPMAAVHHDDLDHGKLNAMFWLSVRLSFLMVGVMVVSAPLLAWFYRDGRLTAATCVLSAGTLALGVTVQHESILIRRMRFATLRRLDIGAMLAGLGTGVLLAALGAGYWALILQVVVTEVSRAASTWWVCNWRPSSPPAPGDRVSIREITSYAGYLSAYQVMMKFARYLDRILVGYFSGATAAGLYYNAQRWAMYVIVQVFPPLLPVAVSGLSRLQHDADAFRSAWRKGMLPVLSVVVPALAFCSLEARGTVMVIMGPQWEGSVPVFRLLCIAALAISMERLSKWQYLSQGATRRQFVWGLIYTPVLIVAVSIGVYWGPVGAAAGFTIACWMLLLPGIAFCLAGSHVRWQDIGAVVWRPTTATVLALLSAIFFANWYSNVTLLVHLALSAAIFGAVYAVTWVALPGGRAVAREMRTLLSSIRSVVPH